MTKDLSLLGYLVGRTKGTNESGPRIGLEVWLCSAKLPFVSSFPFFSLSCRLYLAFTRFPTLTFYIDSCPSFVRRLLCFPSPFQFTAPLYHRLCPELAKVVSLACSRLPCDILTRPARLCCLLYFSSLLFLSTPLSLSPPRPSLPHPSRPPLYRPSSPRRVPSAFV